LVGVGEYQNDIENISYNVDHEEWDSELVQELKAMKDVF
jgi:hypothetical protein